MESFTPRSIARQCLLCYGSVLPLQYSGSGVVSGIGYVWPLDGD
jgi:hypothetical protein